MAAETSIGMKRETAERLDALAAELGLKSKDAAVCRLMALHEIEAARAAHPEATPYWDSARSLSGHADDAFAALIAEYEAARKRDADAAERKMAMMAASLEGARAELDAERRRAEALAQDVRTANAEASREREARLRAEERADALVSKLATMRSLEEILGIMKATANTVKADNAASEPSEPASGQ